MLTRSPLLFLITAAISPAWAYIPGFPRHDYFTGDAIEMLVDKVDSADTQVPYEYYDVPGLCPRTESKAVESENLGQTLMGESIERSSYKISANITQYCQEVCKVSLDTEEIRTLDQMIRDDYVVNLILDNMPAVSRFSTLVEDVGFDKGYPLGFVENDDLAYINNHLQFNIYFNHARKGGIDVVGFEVQPSSHDGQSCSSETVQVVSGRKAGMEIYHTYDVVWRFRDISWTNRWDVYLLTQDVEIHWFSILNSMVIMIFLSSIIGLTLLRTIKRDLITYEELVENEEDMQEETGWKLVHGDVFRPPRNAGLLSVLVGTGMQIMAMLFFTLCFAVAGLLSPSNRGSLVEALLILFSFGGIISGFCSTHLYKTLGASDWKASSFFTAILYPGTCFSVFFILNLIVWAKGSTAAVPFVSLLELLLMWFGISLPLTYLGSLVAYKRSGQYKPPTKVSAIPRLIKPEQPWYATQFFAMVIGGAIPFGTCFIEVFYLMSSVWQHQLYYMFGFLFVVFFLLVVTCAEIAVVMVYIQLCREDYHWWWRSFLAAGSVGIYLFIYSIVFKIALDGLVAHIIYFGYMFLTCMGIFIFCGTSGFLGTWLFVNVIYSYVKID
jgi:transmembrane 9 superfamily protein 2/4